MKFILQSVAMAALLVSCSSVAPADIAGCYRMIIKNDTATMSLNKDGQDITGSLNYNWSEKDDNTGTFQGTIYNDSLIVANYTFQSEGVTSVRQVVFRIRDSVLLQGYGEQYLKNDTSWFRDPQLAVFDSKHPFIKGCQ